MFPYNLSGPTANNIVGIQCMSALTSTTATGQSNAMIVLKKLNQYRMLMAFDLCEQRESRWSAPRHRQATERQRLEMTSRALPYSPNVSMFPQRKQQWARIHPAGQGQVNAYSDFKRWTQQGEKYETDSASACRSILGNSCVSLTKHNMCAVSLRQKFAEA